MLLLAILFPGISLILNGRIIGGLFAIILQIIACLTFVLFGLGFLLWLILAIWAINARNNVKTERKLEKMESRILEKQHILNEEKQKYSTEQSTQTINPKLETESAFILFVRFLGRNYKTILKFGLPIIFILIITKVIYSFTSPDFSDPLAVLKETEKLWRENDLKTYYKYLTEKSQNTYNSYDDFLKKRTMSASQLKNYQSISNSYKEVAISNFKYYKCFQITSKAIKGKDTFTYIYNRILFNENGKWKRVETDEINNKALSYFEKGDFRKAQELYYSALEINPLSIIARNQLVWCYMRGAEPQSTWVDTAAYHLNFLLKTDSTDETTYNTIGTYYTNLKEYKKAVQYVILAIKYSKDSSAIANYYSNAAQDAENYSVSTAKKYLGKSLEYNKQSSFAWQTYGDLLYSEGKYSEADEKYKKAIELVEIDKNIDNFTLINLYGYYVMNCKKLGYKDKAEEYILKCIRVYPDKSHPIFKQLNL